MLSEAQEVQQDCLNPETLRVEQGSQLTQIAWTTKQTGTHGWLQLGNNVYDLFPTEAGYEGTVLTEDYLNFAQVACSSRFRGSPWISARCSLILTSASWGVTTPHILLKVYILKGMEYCRILLSFLHQSSQSSAHQILFIFI